MEQSQKKTSHGRRKTPTKKTWKIKSEDWQEKPKKLLKSKLLKTLRKTLKNSGDTVKGNLKLDQVYQTSRETLAMEIFQEIIIPKMTVKRLKNS